jgi:hypothetical protein
LANTSPGSLESGPPEAAEANPAAPFRVVWGAGRSRRAPWRVIEDRPPESRASAANAGADAPRTPLGNPKPDRDDPAPIPRLVVSPKSPAASGGPEGRCPIPIAAGPMSRPPAPPEPGSTTCADRAELAPTLVRPSGRIVSSSGEPTPIGACSGAGTRVTVETPIAVVASVSRLGLAESAGVSGGSPMSYAPGGQ